MYEVGTAKVKAKIQDDAPLNVSLQMDGWTSFHHGYMGGILGKIMLFIMGKSSALLCFLNHLKHWCTITSHFLILVGNKFDIYLASSCPNL